MISTNVRLGEVPAVYVASFNTRASTELCIRSLRHFAGHPFVLTVGDAGSTDGSIEMLRDFEAQGWLRLEVEPGRRHPQWLKSWQSRTDPRWAVFVDSDIEFLSGPWLPPLIAAAEAGSALVTAEMVAESPSYVEPVGLKTIRVASRPSPWLLLIDRERAQDTALEFDEVMDESEEVTVFNDVGARLLPELRRHGLAWTAMPPSYRRHYHHYGGLSSAPMEGYRGDKKRHDSWVIDHRLRAFRARQRPGPWHPSALFALIPPWAGRYRITQRILSALAG